MPATTINIHLDTLKEISRAAVRLNISRRDLVVRLLMRIMHDIDRYQRGFTIVKYQSDDPEDRWYCFSIRFTPVEYEYFTDLRNICKCSVSLLVAIAAKIYLIEMLSEPKKHVHNYYCFNSYSIYNELSDGKICWRISWEARERCRIKRE